MELLFNLLFHLGLLLNTFWLSMQTTLDNATTLLTNYAFIQLVVLLVRTAWRKRQDMFSKHKKKTHNVAAGVSSMSSSHIAGIHTLF